VMIFWLVSSRERVTATPTNATEVPVAEAPSAADRRAGAPSDAERMVSRANLAFSQRQWQQAASLARAAAMIDPNNAGAKELLQKAQVEAEAQAAYERGVTAINESQWSDAWNQLQAVPATSIYATQTAALREQVKAKLIIDKVREADAALASEDWAKAESLAEELVFLNPTHPDIDRIRGAASEGRKPKVSAAAPKPRVKPRAKTTGKQKPQPAAPAAPAAAPKAAGGDARALYNEAIAALKNNQYPQAIDKLNACIKADKRFCFCYRAMGIAYARVGNGPKAYRFYKQYLKTCPSAKDAADVEKLLRQYEQAQ
jgi:outer membrane protein assembly factor BamD (BamD/ComL family)